MKEFFRANAGALIVNSSGQVLAFKRADLEHDAWQLPQGGIEAGEAPMDAVYREVEEETGITPDKLELLAESERWLAYELPESMRSAKTGRGQVQKWFAFRFHGADDDIRPDALEFSNWQWMEFNALIGQIVQFRRPVYVQLAQMFDRCLSSPIETAPGSS